MAQLSPPKVLAINLTQADPLELWGSEPYPGQPWKFSATITVDPHLHSDIEPPLTGIYDGMNVEVGDFITTNAPRMLQIVEIQSQTNSEVRCTLQDTDRLNGMIDPNQAGESAIQLGFGLLFTAPNGIPLLYPLPGDIGAITGQNLVEILSRFFYEFNIGKSPVQASTFKRYEFTNATEWVIQHNMNTRNFVESLTDFNGNRFYASVEILDQNSFKVNLTEASSGSVNVVFQG